MVEAAAKGPRREGEARRWLLLLLALSSPQAGSLQTAPTATPRAAGAGAVGSPCSARRPCAGARALGMAGAGGVCKWSTLTRARNCRARGRGEEATNGESSLELKNGEVRCALRGGEKGSRLRVCVARALARECLKAVVCVCASVCECCAFGGMGRGGRVRRAGSTRPERERRGRRFSLSKLLLDVSLPRPPRGAPRSLTPLMPTPKRSHSSKY